MISKVISFLHFGAKRSVLCFSVLPLGNFFLAATLVGLVATFKSLKQKKSAGSGVSKLSA
jgi:hypothetical protein